MNLKRVVFKIVSISFSILVTLLVVIGLINLGKYCYNFGYRVFTEKPVASSPGTDIAVTVGSGTSEYELGKQLKRKGLIRDENLFFAQLKLSAYSGRLLPGTYTLNTSMTAKEMMAVMSASEDTEEKEDETEKAKKESETSTQETEDTSEPTEVGDGQTMDEAGEEP